MRRSGRLTGVLTIVFATAGPACEKAGSADVMTDGGVEGDAGALLCAVEPPTICPDPAPRFADVQPILQERCVVCHSGLPGGPWPLLQYSHVADWQDVIRGQMLDCSMPPPDAGVRMEATERVAILTWILCGSLE
jgi:hypothetical protein